MSVDDVSFSAFRAIAFGIGLRTCFGSGGGRLRPGARRGRLEADPQAGLVLLCVGAAVAWLGLLTVSEVQTSERLSDIVTARYYSFPDATRELAQIGLVGLPACVWGVKALGDRQERDRRRSLLSTYLRIATKAYLSGDYDRAIAEYSIAIKVDPKRTEVYIQRGQAWWQKGDYTLAIADFDRALKLDAGHSPAYLQPGDRPGRPRRPRRGDLRLRLGHDAPPVRRRGGPPSGHEPGEARRDRPGGRRLPPGPEGHQPLRLRRAGAVPSRHARGPTGVPALVP